MYIFPKVNKSFLTNAVNYTGNHHIWYTDIILNVKIKSKLLNLIAILFCYKRLNWTHWKDIWCAFFDSQSSGSTDLYFVLYIHNYFLILHQVCADEKLPRSMKITTFTEGRC